MSQQSHIHPHTISFLEYLTEHNDKEHFLQAKPLYIEIQDQLNLFTQELIGAIATFDDTIDPQELQPKQCLFRIYRDARFSHNKSPYKTNFGIVIWPDGKKSTLAGYYIHMQPKASFFGGGIYRPEKDQLLNLRHYLALHGDVYKKIIKKSAFVQRFGQIQWERTSRTPKWFEAYTPHLDLILRKQHLLYHKYTDSQVLAPDRFQHLIKDCRTAQERFSFLNTGCKYEDRKK